MGRVRRLVVVLVVLVSADFVASGMASAWVPRFSFLPRPPDQGWVWKQSDRPGVNYDRGLILWVRGESRLV
jgi:hypothetical protein